MERFEPSNIGIKNQCLTTWRHPINCFKQNILCGLDFELNLDPDRIELSTLHLSGVCSNQLNYGSITSLLNIDKIF